MPISLAPFSSVSVLRNISLHYTRWLTLISDFRCSTVKVKKNILYIQRLKFSSPADPQIQLDWWVSKPQRDLSPPPHLLVHCIEAWKYDMDLENKIKFKEKSNF